MNELGKCLKELRNNKGLSLANVYQSTKITDSRLSKVENGAENTLKPHELRKLAKLYETGLVKLFVMAGYLTASDLEEYHSGFKNTDLLESDEMEHIQCQIDFIIRKKG